MASSEHSSKTLAICFGQFGPYHHARVAALQRAAVELGVRVVPVQIAAATSTYAWSARAGACEDLRTLCEGTDEGASPLGVFLKARKLFRDEKVDVAFLPSYSPARFFALFAAAKSLGIQTVMMNESHAGTEQATGSAYAMRVYGVTRRWIKWQIVKQFDAAFVGGEPHKRHFASLGIPAERIFTGYDAVDNDFFASRADAVRAAAKKSDVWRVTSDELGNQPEPLNIRDAYGLPERYFLSLGRMVEKKNLATLIAAYGRYCDEWREPESAEIGRRGDQTSDESARQAPASLVFVGSGELESALREQASGLGLTVVDRTNWKAGQSSETRDSLPAISHKENCGTVFFYGFRQIEENPIFYALAEAFVLPSLKEEWGLVVNEAMACSLPVIVSRTAGCAEDLLPGSAQVTSDGWRVTSKDAEDRKLTAESSRQASQRPTGSDGSVEERPNGFIFDPRSSDALATALARVADPLNPQRSTLNAAAMGRRSREIVAKFSCENFARQALRAAEAASA